MRCVLPSDPGELQKAYIALQAKVEALTRELGEMREQQRATSQVLQVISRSTFDLQTVLETLTESAARLCEADYAWLFQREGELFRLMAIYGNSSDVQARLRDFFKTRDVRAERGSITGRAALKAQVVHVPDVLADPEYTWSGAQEIGDYRAALGAPLLREGNVAGVIFVAKTAPQPFTEKQIELVTTFADQAVIAIENTRLLNELQQSLEYQTAISEVLNVISRSPSDIHPVLQTIAETAQRLCRSEHAYILRLDGGRYHLVAAKDAEIGRVNISRKIPFFPIAAQPLAVSRSKGVPFISRMPRLTRNIPLAWPAIVMVIALSWASHCCATELRLASLY
jgi:two-component system NtrC family sensor kinase